MKIRSRIPSTNSGMSLLEVLIALSILAVGLLGIASLQITAIKGNATADETAVAAYYAQEKLEEFRRTPFDNLVSSPGIVSGAPDYASIPTDNAVNSKLSKKAVRIYRVWNVVNTTATLKTISVWSCWQEGGVRWHSVHFVTRKGNVL
jgi:prepilin-type N-terminal cleavage/methylation domain-containing protein